MKLPASPSMRRRDFATGLVAAAALPSATIAQSSPTGPTSALDQAAAQFLQATNAAGLAIGTVSPQGRSLHTYGLADRASGQPVDASTLFEIGSISKTFTTALAAVAVARGAMRWSDQPGRFVPDVRGPGTDRLSLLNLATHTTGDMPLQLPPEATSWDETAAWLRRWTPLYPPGQYRSYANASIGLLGVVTARALGGNFADLMRQHVLGPLQLDSTFYQISAADQARYAQGQRRDGRPVRLASGPMDAEAYGVRTTVSDLLRWVEAQVGLITVRDPLRPALLATQAAHFQIGPMNQALVWEWYPAPVTNEALLTGNGEDIVFRPNPATPLAPPQRPPRGALVQKTGGTNGFGAYAAFCPDRQTGFVILANRSHPTPQRLALASTVRAILNI